MWSFLGLGRTPRGAPLLRVPAGWVRPLGGGRPRWVWAFELDQRPVSNRDWLAFMNATGAPTPPWMYRPGFDDPDQPVVGVAERHAQAFARWAGKRLPSELEWARAAGPGPYPWGSRAATRDHAVFKARAPSPPTRPDGAGPYGHLDLTGNVWERLHGGVARGGFWGSPDPTSALRLVLAADDISSGIGSAARAESGVASVGRQGPRCGEARALAGRAARRALARRALWRGARLARRALWRGARSGEASALASPAHGPATPPSAARAALLWTEAERSAAGGRAGQKARAQRMG
ncbi:MAG: SUMF1/EgtB/PvdO family nonheme iron enzyme [Myxococcota bacterium]